MVFFKLSKKNYKILLKNIKSFKTDKIININYEYRKSIGYGIDKKIHLINYLFKNIKKHNKKIINYVKGE